MKIIVASQNPVKVEAVEMGFNKLFPQAHKEIGSVDVDSGVGNQPYGDEETKLGATNRANNAKMKLPQADYWVGIEGGVKKIGNDLAAMAHFAILDKTGRLSHSKSAVFYLPPAVTKMIHEGVELGHAHDKLFSTSNSKQKGGMIGFLTDDVITRAEYYVQPVIMALIPFNKPDFYDNN